MNRAAGIVMSLTSLPSPHGIGTMGRAAYDFIDFLKASGMCWWQVLPLGPTGYGDSPYASCSTYAGNPYLIDLDMLIADGLLSKEDVAGVNWGDDLARTDYGRIYENRFAVLRRAFERGFAAHRADVARLRRENHWLDDYALFMALKNHFSMKAWTEWPEEIRLRRPEAMARYREKLGGEMDYWCFLQYLFFRQWAKLKAYAKEQGIRFLGDIPIYVAMDSADVWAEPKYFQLDELNRATEVAGVPPDAYTEDGQLWGNPLYRWDVMAADGYGWWIRRIDGARKLYDAIRIDHFRGLVSYWAVPAEETTAKHGRWVQGPGYGFVKVIKDWFHDVEFVAEDLGYVTPELGELLKKSGFPGMKPLQFAFDPDGDCAYLPHNCEKNSITYGSTHDNETINGWAENIDERTRAFAAAYCHKTQGEGWCHAIIRTGMASPSVLFLTQMQDVLDLPGSTRMNAPGTLGGNWTWRLTPGQYTAAHAKKLHELARLYRRAE